MNAIDRWLVKFEARDAAAFDAEAHIPVFHRWIQQKRLPLVLIDVADYAHVPDGPGVLLVSHEFNIFADRFDGRPGLTVQRRARGGGGAASLVETLAIGLKAVQALTEEKALPGSRFRLDSAEVVVNDRLRGPNDEEGWRAAEPAIREAAARLYGKTAKVERRDEDPGRRLAARISGDADHAGAMLLRLGA